MAVTTFKQQVGGSQYGGVYVAAAGTVAVYLPDSDTPVQVTHDASGEAHTWAPIVDGVVAFQIDADPPIGRVQLDLGNGGERVNAVAQEAWDQVGRVPEILANAGALGLDAVIRALGPEQVESYDPTRTPALRLKLPAGGTGTGMVWDDATQSWAPGVATTTAATYDTPTGSYIPNDTSSALSYDIVTASYEQTSGSSAYLWDEMTQSYTLA